VSSFTRHLTVTKIGARTWRVEKGFDYHVGDESSSDVVQIPKGFETDFASVPRIFWMIFPPDGKYTQAAVLHDYMAFRSVRSKEDIDHIFLEAMRVLKVSKVRRKLIYYAVKYFGRYGV